MDTMGCPLSAATTVAGSSGIAPRKFNPFLFGEGFAAALLEEIDLLTAMGTEEAAHVLHKAEHVRFDDLEEIKRLGGRPPAKFPAGW